MKLKFDNITIQEARILNPKSIKHIYHKVDGSFHHFINNHLISERGIIKDNNFPHILKLLIKNKFPACIGEIYYKDFETSKVFDVTKKANNHLCKFMIIDILNSDLSYKKKQEIIKKKIKQTNFITEMREYSDLETAWKYIVDTNSEGIIIKTDYKDYKVKKLQEVKIKIKRWEKGKEKGTFILENDNRISGTSIDFVKKFLKNKDNSIAEIEYAYITKEGHYFQPRLRNLLKEI